MKKALRYLGAAALSVGMVWLLGCAHLWRPPKPTVIFGPPLVEGDAGKIVVSVANIPHKGLGALAVEVGGFKYPEDKMGDFSVEGLNGFEALVWSFSGGEGGFVIASTSGIEAGPVAEIRFKASGKVSPSEIVIDPEKISLASAENTLVEGFEVSSQAYYAR